MCACVCVHVCVCVCVCVVCTQFNPTRWLKDCMYVDRGKDFVMVMDSAYLSVCLSVSLFDSPSLHPSVYLFVSVSLLDCLCPIWLFDFDFLIFSVLGCHVFFLFFILIDHFHFNICLTVRPAVFLQVPRLSVFMNHVSLLSVFFVCCRHSWSPTHTYFPPPPFLPCSQYSEKQTAIMSVNHLRGCSWHG